MFDQARCHPTEMPLRPSSFPSLPSVQILAEAQTGKILQKRTKATKKGRRQNPFANDLSSSFPSFPSVLSKLPGPCLLGILSSFGIRHSSFALPRMKMTTRFVAIPPPAMNI
jgi:hypothetical protein